MTMFGSQFGLLSGIKKTGARAAIATGLAIMAIICADSSTYARADTVSGVATTPPRTGWMEKFTPAVKPDPLPATGFTEQDGTIRTVKDFGGRIVLMNFWATWCAPCVHEMPSLDRLAAHFKGRPLALVALNEDRGGATVAAPFLARMGLTHLALYIDPKGVVQRALGVASLPTTIIFDARGRLVGRLAMPADWAAPEALALIEHFVSRAR